MDEFIAKHGKHSLKMHVYRTGEEEEPNPKLPFMKLVEGRLVMVKSNTEDSVTLLDMETTDVFEVPMDEYQERCNNVWLLDEGLMFSNPDEFERQSNIVRRAYEACGFNFK